MMDPVHEAYSRVDEAKQKLQHATAVINKAQKEREVLIQQYVAALEHLADICRPQDGG